MYRSAGPSRAAGFLLASWLLSLLGPVAPAGAQISFLMGQVLDEQGNAVADAAVVASREETGSERFEARSDRNGRFAIVGLRSGIWVFTATAQGFVPGTQAARVAMGRTQSAVEIRLQRPVEVPTVLGDIDAGALQAELAHARTLLAEGRFDEALAAYGTVQARVPALTSLHLLVAEAHHLKGDSAAAVAAFERCLAVDPAWARPSLRLAELAEARGDTAAAQAHARRVLEVAPAAPEADEARLLLQRLP